MGDKEAPKLNRSIKLTPMTKEELERNAGKTKEQIDEEYKKFLKETGFPF